MSERRISTVIFDKPVRTTPGGGMSSALEAKRLPKGARIVIVQLGSESFVTVEGMANVWHVSMRKVETLKFEELDVAPAVVFDDTPDPEAEVDGVKLDAEEPAPKAARAAKKKAAPKREGFTVEP